MSANNNCSFVGRIVKDPDVRVSQSGKASVRFSIAVPRTYKEQNGEYGVDYINCSMFGKRAEALGRFFHKGSRISLYGEWRSGNYEKDGHRYYTNELQVQDFAFIDTSKDVAAEPAVTHASNATGDTKDANGFTAANSDDYMPFEDLPFT